MNNLFPYLTVAAASATGWVMNPLLRVSLSVGVVLFLVILLVMLRKKRLILKYTLLWLLSVLGLVVFLIFPQVVIRGSALIGVDNPVNAVFLMFAGFSLLLILSLTSIVSQLSDRNRTLTQSLALLEERIRRLEGKKAENEPQEDQ